MQSNDRAALAPEFRRLAPPVIIVGMHRSGTSLVAGMLNILGVYVDPTLPLPQQHILLDIPGERMRQNGYGEATCFRLLNEEVMAQSGADWIDIAPFLQHRDRPEFKRQSLARIGRATFRALKQQFLSPLPPDYTGPWGWKDPRNSLTLPYWIELFPQARILHVRRNPDDIAKSLIRRAQAEAEEAAAAPPPTPIQRIWRAIRNPQKALRAVGIRLGILSRQTHSPRTALDPSTCLALTHEYVEACLQFRTHEHYMEVWYEDIIQEPEAYARLLADFLALQPSEAQLQHASRFVKPRLELQKKPPSETSPETAKVSPRQ